MTFALLVGGALATTLPVAWLTTIEQGETGTALPLEAIAATGATGPNYLPAAALERTALLGYFRMLGGTAIATLIVALLAALGLAAARASQRTGETTIRRAVGAGRRLLYAGRENGAILAGLTLGGLRRRRERGPTGHPGLAGWAGRCGRLGGRGHGAFTGLLLVAGLAAPGAVRPAAVARRRAPGRAAPPPDDAARSSLIVLVAGALLARHATRLLVSGTAAAREGAVTDCGRACGGTGAVPSYKALLERVTSPAA
jgi:hypothetical protein